MREEAGVSRQQDHREKKKTYDAPRLQEYGSVERLTEGGAISSANDHGKNMMRP